MFLVLADHVSTHTFLLAHPAYRAEYLLSSRPQSLFAYQLEALVPSSVPTQNPSTQRGPERLSGTAHVLFFSVGKLSNRTLVAYCKKKQLDSVFRVLEPIPIDARGDHGRRNFFGGGGQKGASFRVFKVSEPSQIKVLIDSCTELECILRLTGLLHPVGREADPLPQGTSSASLAQIPSRLDQD